MAPTEKPRYLLVSSPRTASNMLMRILNLEAQGVRPVTVGGCFFLRSRATSLFTPHHSPMKTWTDEEHASVNEAQQTAFGKLQGYIAAAEQVGQSVYCKEHAFTLTDPFFWSQYTFGPDAVAGIVRSVESAARSALNITTMPDEFLKTWKPTFLIRHPAVMLPSMYRTRQLDFEMDGIKPRMKGSPCRWKPR